ncbi:MAG: TonB-dependent receptor [Bacteroidetes bacterium]|nr:TonB-dependent receptor [Bacteroidota bacterium]MDA1120098.1 TonB-dependent receptor [Bacteroidota bacterium]
MSSIKTNVVALMSVVALSSPRPCFGQEADTVQLAALVITGTKFEIPVEKSGKSIYKISGQDLEKYSGRSVGDVLNDVPGIQIDGNYSTPAQAYSYFVRGGTNRHTLILIDGMPLNDPTAISTDYDLRQLSVGQVESIEVLRGGLSTLYGTGAAAAVINIQLKKSEADNFSGDLDLNGGSYNSFGQQLNLRGNSGKLSFVAIGSNFKSEGISAALETNPTDDFDKDGLSRQNALVKIGYQISDRWKLDLTTAYDQFEADFDGGQFFDAANVQNNSQFRVGLKPAYHYDKGNASLNILFNRNVKEFSGDWASESTGRNLQYDYNHRHEIGKNITALFGVYVQHLEYDDVQDGFESQSGDTTRFNIVAPFASLVFDYESGFNLHGGLRLNSHSEYGNEMVYNINPSYRIELTDDVQLKLISSISKSFVSPSLYQVYSFFGKRELQPEQAINYETRFLISVNNGLTFNAVYYRRDEKNPIGFVSLFDDLGNFIGGGYDNISDERKVEGFEGEFSWQIGSKFGLSATYALLESDVDASLYRMPKHKLGLSLNYKPIESSMVSLRFNHTSDREIQDFNSGGTIILEDYQLIDVFASHKFFEKRLTFYGSINNLMDTDFVGIYGFTTRGRNFNAGVKWEF